MTTNNCVTYTRKRLDYLDAIRGFAIFLVVFAHVIAWSYSVEYFKEDMSLSWLWHLIYSFHMPLFFFISGYLCLGSVKKRTAFEVIKRRTLQILFPYISATLFVTFVLQQEMNYWYLIALYWMNIVVAVTSKSRYKVMPLIVWAIICIAAFACPSINDLPYVFIPSFKAHFIYFMCGYYFAMYPKLESWVKAKLYRSSLFVFLSLYLFQINVLHTDNTVLTNVIGGGRIGLLIQCLKAFAAVFFFFYLFKQMTCKEFVRDWFTKIGRFTLEIYVFHVMFKFAIPKLGDNMINLGIEFPVIIQSIFAFIISVILIEVSIFIGKTIRKDKILSLYFLGGKWHK